MSILCDAICQVFCEVICQSACYQCKQCCCPDSANDKNLNNQQKSRELQNKLLSQQQEQQKKKKRPDKKNKQQIPVVQQNFSYLVQQLYDLSKNKYEVPGELISFVGPQQSQQELIKYYAQGNSKIEEELMKQLIGYRRIRVDGNSFYTAFTYQYLEYVLNILNFTQFNILISKIQTMNFKIQFQEGFRIPTEARNSLANCFAHHLIELRRYPQDLFKQFSDSSNLLFGLSILFMRNLVNKYYCRSKMAQMVDDSLSKDFLFWEKECSIKEIVMAFLADKLKLQIHCYFVDSLKVKFKHEVYNEQNVYSIHLLQDDGHYQIGIPIDGGNK